MILIKTGAEIQRMREAGRVCAQCMDKVLSAVEPGITTGELDALARDIILKSKGVPSFKDYRGFSGNICTSVNSEVVHGIPGKRKLAEGEILSIDMGVCLMGYHSDMARTVAVGKISEDAQKLINATERCFFEGIKKAVPGNRINDISQVIEFTARAAGYSVVRELVGHGIGASLHEAPDIPNYSSSKRGPRLKEGMVLAVEPMVNIGKSDVIWLADGWTVKTADGSLSAHYENTLAVTESGPEILTMGA